MFDTADSTEPALANDSTEASEKAELIDRTDPTDPIDKIDPADPIDRIDPTDPIDKMDPLEPMLRIEPAEPCRRCRESMFRIGRFSQPCRSTRQWHYALANDPDSRRTRRMLPPAKAARSASDQPRCWSSANRAGYRDTSCRPAGKAGVPS
jgi:hypothetical protein